MEAEIPDNLNVVGKATEWNTVDHVIQQGGASVHDFRGAGGPMDAVISGGEAQRRKNFLAHVRLNSRLDGWLYGWVHGWGDGWVHGWV